MDFKFQKLRCQGAFYSFTTLIKQKGMRAFAEMLSFEIVPSQGSVVRYLEIPIDLL